MNTPKLLISTVATIAVVGAIGFTNAQTGDNMGKNEMGDSTSAPKNVDQAQAPSGNMNADTGSTSATGTPSSDSSNEATERVAKADRN